MFGLRSSVMFGLVLWMAVVMGIVAGANVGYTVENPQNASASYNGTHIQIGDEAPENVTLDFNESNQTAYEQQIERVSPNYSTPLDAHIQDGVRSFTRTTVHTVFTLTFVAADVSAGFFYNNQWLPKPLVTGFLHVVGFAPFVGVFLSQLSRVARFWQ